jgi:hypothetical protein
MLAAMTSGCGHWQTRSLSANWRAACSRRRASLCVRSVWLHPVGLLPKGDTKVRLIHDFSSPGGASLNDYIDYVRCSYDKLDVAYAAMRTGCWLAKIDIEAFFRHIGMDPFDWPLLAFRWRDHVLCDLA